jgi:hypothetical protein
MNLLAKGLEGKECKDIDFYKWEFRGLYKCGNQKELEDLHRVKTVDRGLINLRYKEVPIGRKAKVKTIEEWASYKTKVERIDISEKIKKVYRQEMYLQNKNTPARNVTTLIRNKLEEIEKSEKRVSGVKLIGEYLDTFYMGSKLENEFAPPEGECEYNLELESIKKYQFVTILGSKAKILEKRVWLDYNKEGKPIVKYLLKWERADFIEKVLI